MAEQMEDMDMGDFDGITSTQVLNRVNALIKLNEAQGDLSEEMEKEIRAIQKKYDALFAPLYQKRTEIVKGDVEPSGEDIVPKEPIEVPELDAGSEKGIPKFWLSAIMNHPFFAQMMSEVDDDALEHLIDVNIVEEDEAHQFNVNFVFATNPFFNNDKLTVTVKFDEAQTDLEDIDVTPIQWKDGKNFTIKRVEKTIKKKGPKGKAAATTTKVIEEPVPCLFSTLFNKQSMIPSEEDEEQEMVGGIAAQYQGLIILKDTIIPQAVDWFLGRGVDENDDGGFDEGMYGDEDYDMSEEEEDIPQIKPKGKAKITEAPPKPAAANPECKQN